MKWLDADAPTNNTKPDDGDFTPREWKIFIAGICVGLIAEGIIVILAVS